MTNKTIRKLKRGQIDPVELAAGILFGCILENQKGKKMIRKHFPKSIQNAVLKIQRNRCNMCGKKLEEINFDHIDGNRSNNSITNCQALCPNCHAKKSRQRKGRIS